MACKKCGGQLGSDFKCEHCGTTEAVVLPDAGQNQQVAHIYDQHHKAMYEKEMEIRTLREAGSIEIYDLKQRHATEITKLKGELCTSQAAFDGLADTAIAAKGWELDGKCAIEAAKRIRFWSLLVSATTMLILFVFLIGEPGLKDTALAHWRVATDWLLGLAGIAGALYILVRINDPN